MPGIFDYAAGKAFASILGGGFVVWVIGIVMMASLKDQIDYPSVAVGFSILVWAITLGLLYFMVIYAPQTREGA
jgi:hypothetical protein